MASPVAPVAMPVTKSAIRFQLQTGACDPILVDAKRCMAAAVASSCVPTLRHPDQGLRERVSRLRVVADGAARTRAGHRQALHAIDGVELHANDGGRMVVTVEGRCLRQVCSRS